MSARVLTLVEFLLARIAEDEERTARDLSGATVVTRHGERLAAGGMAYRFKRETAAKRAIVAAHPYSADGDHCCADRTDSLGEKMYYRGRPCPTLRALATVYADHPDWRQEWAL